MPKTKGSYREKLTFGHGRKGIESSSHKPIKVLNEKSVLQMGGSALEKAMLSITSLAIYNVSSSLATVAEAHNKRSTLPIKSKKYFTVYSIHVQNAIKGRSWIVCRRYSDFLLFRERVLNFFQQQTQNVPRLCGMVNQMYFPRKHKLRSKTEKVVEHRCQAFLGFLVALHRVLISPYYAEVGEIAEIGFSLLRGFLGSQMVANQSHKEYAYPHPILQHLLSPGERIPVNQCGALKTVLEADCEDDDNVTILHIGPGEVDGLDDDILDSTHVSSSSEDYDRYDEFAPEEPAILEEVEIRDSKRFHRTLRVSS